MHLLKLFDVEQESLILQFSIFIFHGYMEMNSQL